MKLAEFEKLMAEFQKEEQELLRSKREEYAETDGDVLSNFATTAELAGFKPVEVAAILLAKHVQAILKASRDLDTIRWTWNTEAGKEGFKQRIADARNYLLLLGACVDDELLG